MKKNIVFVLFSISVSVLSAPREIIIIRHADKWTHNAGQFLSPRGQIRAEKIIPYYLSHFALPDYIFATKPGNKNTPGESTSIRPLQTVAPLANQLSYQTKKNVIVHTPYYQHQFPMLAKELLHQKKYNQKLILVCWQHSRINCLAHDLGVVQKLATWANNNYDMVYVLKYDAQGKLNAFQILKNQYPVNVNPSWNQLAR